VKYFTYLLYSTIAIIALSVSLSNVFASQMSSFLIPERNKSEPLYTSIDFLTIKYDPGSELAKKFAGLNERISFKVNSTNPGLNDIIKTVNNVILTERNSPVRVSDAKIDYTVQIRGEQDRMTVAYKLVFAPSISGYVLPGNESAKIVDLDWRSFKVNDPLTIEIPNYGKIDLNYPISAFQMKYPEIATELLSSDAKGIMTDPLFNFEDIGLPMERWHFLFDPTGSQASAAGSGYIEESGAKVVSVFSLGESSFREGTHTAREFDAKATIEGVPIEIHSSTPPVSGQIQIPGFAEIKKVGNAEIAYVSDAAPSGVMTSSGGFPIQVLGVFVGMMAGVAALVLLMVRKKN